MREIKFRAWIIDEKKMVQIDELNGLEKWKDKEMIGCNGLDRSIGIQGGSHNMCIIMQYTGLKDKNGKEIYDKDVLKYRNEEVLYICQWDNENAWRGFRPPYGRMHNHPLKDMKGLCEAEVIGNIYKNTEILNSK